MLGLGGNAVAFALRAAVMEKTRFSRPLFPLILETALGLGLLGAAFAAMRTTAPLMESLGLISTISVMLASAAALLALGLGLDQLMSRLRERPSLLGSLQSLRQRA